MAKSRPGRPSGKAAPRKRAPWRDPKILGVAGLVIALAAGGGAAWGLKGNDSEAVAPVVPQSPADKWEDGITRDLAGASQGTLDYLKVVYDWSAGKADAQHMSDAADQAFFRYTEAREFLAKRTAFEPAPRALANFRDTFELYTDTARLAKLGSGVESAELRTQIQRQIFRLRQLADRLYDLAKSELDPFRGRDTTLSSLEYIRPAQVPAFEGSTAEAGPPLVGAAPTPAAEREYQETRPEQEFDAWVGAVKALNLPSAQSIVDAISKGDGAELGRLAVALTKASDTLYDAPDPKGNRTLSTRIQLGLLVQAEAMRTAQIAALATKAERPVAVQIAETLAFVGTRIWDPRLGDRSTGLSERLLERKPI